VDFYPSDDKPKSKKHAKNNSMSKKLRDFLFNKYNGRCAYCGDMLEKGWHIDEIEPVRRNHIYDRVKKKFVINKDNPMQHPERLTIENQNPSCPSCNINKHSLSLEEFRLLIKGFTKHLNEKSTQYKIAKRYGLVQENEIDVVFYFEKIV
jgi:5-methylcytosine-specific restriction endonuclease McrA